MKKIVQKFGWLFAILVVILIVQNIPGAIPEVYKFELGNEVCYWQEGWEDNVMCMDEKSTRPRHFKMPVEEIQSLIVVK